LRPIPTCAAIPNYLHYSLGRIEGRRRGGKLGCEGRRRVGELKGGREGKMKKFLMKELKTWRPLNPNSAKIKTFQKVWGKETRVRT